MALEHSLKIIIRPCDPDSDIALIFTTWRNSIWFDEKRDPKIAHQFFRKQTGIIKNILNSPDASVRIACLETDPDIIAGYAVFMNTNLEWVYVKPDYRESGVGTVLIKGSKTIAKPLTKIGRAITEKKQLKEKHADTEGTKETKEDPTTD